MTTRKKVGLVLGSGSSRGWAHIGAIEALEEAGIPIDFIVGCSVGSYVGALYACGSLASLKDFVIRMNGKKVFSYFDVVFPRSGLLDGSRKVKELARLSRRPTDRWRNHSRKCGPLSGTRRLPCNCHFLCL